MKNILEKTSTRAPKGWNKEATKKKTEVITEQLTELQNLLYAEGKHSLLVILQGMDASGKDGVVKKVLGRLNPLGVVARAFKTPTAEEAAHDFLWRVHAHAPAKGIIQVFNRSHYEDVLITRVHKWCSDELAKKRMKAINNFEQLLEEHNSTRVLKFYLHISREEQAKRLQERIEDPAKNWKYNAKDKDEAILWDEYRKMYEDVFAHCKEIPWTIVPADQNWYKEYTIAKKLLDTLQSLNMKYPGLPASKTAPAAEG